MIGARFFVMERRTRRRGARSSIPDELAHHADVARRVSFALVDAMADLHDVDYAKAGLADLGRPEGFAERQVGGLEAGASSWRRTPRSRASTRCTRASRASIPRRTRASLVHNDLKLDNCQFDPADPDRVKSIFDWDMTTLGDPLVDLGTLLGYWSQPDDPADRSPTNALTNQPGFPTRRELAERYAARRGRPPRAASTGTRPSRSGRPPSCSSRSTSASCAARRSDERFRALGPRVPLLVRLAADVLARRG